MIHYLFTNRLLVKKIGSLLRVSVLNEKKSWWRTIQQGNGFVFYENYTSSQNNKKWRHGIKNIATTNITNRPWSWWWLTGRTRSPQFNDSTVVTRNNSGFVTAATNTANFIFMSSEIAQRLLNNAIMKQIIFLRKRPDEQMIIFCSRNGQIVFQPSKAAGLAPYWCVAEIGGG